MTYKDVVCDVTNDSISKLKKIRQAKVEGEYLFLNSQKEVQNPSGL